MKKLLTICTFLGISFCANAVWIDSKAHTTGIAKLHFRYLSDADTAHFSSAIQADEFGASYISAWHSVSGSTHDFLIVWDTPTVDREMHVYATLDAMGWHSWSSPDADSIEIVDGLESPLFTFTIENPFDPTLPDEGGALMLLLCGTALVFAASRR